MSLRRGSLFVVGLMGACGPQAGDVSKSSATETGTSSSSSTPMHASTTDADVASGTSMDAAESTTTGAPAPEGCTCRTPSTEEYPDCEDAASITCDAEAICPALALRCPREENLDIYACDRELIYDEEALDCMLAALRDRNPGKLFTSRPGVVCGLEGCGSDAIEIVVLADGTVVTTECGREPLSPAYSSSSVRALREPAYFVACLELDVPRDRYDCMLDGITYDARVCG